MQINRDEYLLLSRGGRVPRSSRAGPLEPYLVLEAGRDRAGRPARGRGRMTRRLVAAIAGAGDRLGGTRPSHDRDR